MANVLIKFENVEKRFDQKQVVQNLSFDVYTGEIFVLVGTSGSGKTTTLRMVNELLAPTAGEIYFSNKPIKGYNVRELRLQMGYVLQQIALFPNMSVAQNIALIPSMKKQDKAGIAQLVDQMLTDVNLNPQIYRDRMPNELSGGEQQRVGILRAFASQPKVVLMDEPFSALDPISRTQLQDLVLDIHAKLHSTILFVTHDMDEALKLGDRIGVMRAGEILQIGTPQDIVQHPKHEFVQQLFENSMAHNVYDVFLSKLNVMGYSQTANEQRNVPILSQDENVKAALSALIENTEILIKTDGGQLKRLTRENIYQFMSDYRNHS